MKTDIDVIDNIVQAVSILNKVSDYLESLDNKLSEYDQLKSDFEHIVENDSFEKINLEAFFDEFKNCLLNRRKIKKDLSLSTYYKNNIAKLQEKCNREFLIQGLKNVNSKTDSYDYKNRILTSDIINKFEADEVTHKRGRPKKAKEGA